MMKKVATALSALTVFGAIALAGCGANAPTSESAPEVTLDDLGTADMGWSYNGWEQNSWIDVDGNYATLYHNLTRYWGDSTRGGGACVVTDDGPGCSSDSDCLSNAQTWWGSEAWGYCVSGQCYSRPGSQSTWCALNPNRSSGTLQGPGFSIYDSHWFALGCMTKGGGPNYACGGSDPSQYMRELVQAYY